MTARLIVIAGIDGAGKETQCDKLHKKLVSKGMRAVIVSYPMYGKTLFGMLLHFVLKSEFAKLFSGSFGFANTDPLAASLLYAADRRQSLPYLKQLIKENDVVIFDRYVEANLIHQGGKIEMNSERRRFAEKIMKIEYDILELPKPDVTIYLHIPYEVSIKRAKLRAKQRGETPDIVEMDKKYVTNSYMAAQMFWSHFNWQIVSGVIENDTIYTELTEDEIHEKVCEVLGIK